MSLLTKRNVVGFACLLTIAVTCSVASAQNPQMQYPPARQQIQQVQRGQPLGTPIAQSQYQAQQGQQYQGQQSGIRPSTAQASPIPTRSPEQSWKRKPFKLSPVTAVDFQEIEEELIVPGAVEVFHDRNGMNGVEVYPAPLGNTLSGERVHGPIRLPSNGPKDEYLIDGSDRNQRAYVDEDWKVYGLDVEDTIGHFDTLDGRRIAAPSNRVAIYSPRFASVRRVSDVGNSSITARVASADERTQTAVQNFDDLTASTKQNLQPMRHKISQQALGFEDRTRGLTSESLMQISGMTTGWAPYEDIQLIKFGRMNSSESTRFNVGMQAANAWTDNLRVNIENKITELILVNEVGAAQDITLSETKGANPTLRVAKVASRITAKPGDTVEFTLRFDNVGNQTIGNITILDSLTPRLEYLDGTAECSVEADFIMQQNDANSLVLRWEVRDPLPVGKGGLIRFKCRVR